MILSDLRKKIYYYFKNLLSRFFSKKLGGYYTSIDEIPIYNWWKISDGKIEFIKTDKRRLSFEVLEKAVEDLQQEYFDVFGVSDEFVRYFENKKEVLELECERILKGNRFLGTRINLLKIEIDRINKKERNNDLFEVKAYVDKFLGTRLNPKELTVREFYTYLEIMKKGNGKD